MIYSIPMSYGSWSQTLTKIRNGWDRVRKAVKTLNTRTKRKRQLLHLSWWRLKLKASLHLVDVCMQPHSSASNTWLYSGAETIRYLRSTITWLWMTFVYMISVIITHSSCCHIGKNTWIAVMNYGCYPEGRFSHAMCCVPGHAESYKLLIFGGQNMKNYCPATLYQFDTSNRFMVVKGLYFFRWVEYEYEGQVL